jgi:hypothetical protein
MNIASWGGKTRSTRNSSALLVAVLLGACGCCHVQTAFVPVREAIYRTEVSTTNRLALPLAGADREFLLLFLKSGCNPTLDAGGTIADPEAPKRYAVLFELLSRPDQLWVTNLIANETIATTTAYRPWFPDPAVRQVVDAHESGRRSASRMRCSTARSGIGGCLPRAQATHSSDGNPRVGARQTEMTYA